MSGSDANWYEDMAVVKEARAVVAAAGRSAQDAWDALAAAKVVRPFGKEVAAPVLEEGGDGRWTATLRELRRFADGVEFGDVLGRVASTGVHGQAERSAVALYASWWRGPEARLALRDDLEGEDAEAQWREAASLAGEAEWVLRNEVRGMLHNRVHVGYEEDGPEGPEMIAGLNFPSGRTIVFERVALPPCFDVEGEVVGCWAPSQASLTGGLLSSFEQWCKVSELAAAERAMLVERSVVDAVQADTALQEWLCGAGSMSAQAACSRLGGDVLETDWQEHPDAGVALRWRAAGPEASLWEPYDCNLVVSAVSEGGPEQDRSIRVEFVDAQGEVARCRRGRWAGSQRSLRWDDAVEDSRRCRARMGTEAAGPDADVGVEQAPAVEGAGLGLGL